MNALFVAAFVVSGAAGLFYELLWTRYLALFVGHAAYAQVLVISVFLGGLAIGSLVVGDRSKRLSDPLRWYIIVEVVLAVLGLLYHPLYTTATGLAYDTVYPALGAGLGLSAVKWSIAVLLILPQAILLGATFPLMAAAVVRRAPESGGRTVSVLYAANSFGAAAGVLVAGFLAVSWLGLPGSMVGAAALNLAAAVLAWRAGREHVAGAGDPSDPVREPAPAPAAPGEPSDRDRQLWSVLLLVAGGTAFASFLYEIAWIRMLALVMGSATHAFELMLSAFILGLALGALLIRDRADSKAPSIVTLAGVQWCMGLAALATLPLYAAAFPLMGWMVDTVPSTDGGYLAFNVGRYGLGLLVMLPSTTLAGMTLPLITANLLRAGGGERSIGWVYGINTMGSVLGVMVGGLLSLTLLGLRGTLILGALIDMALGVYLWAQRDRLGDPRAEIPRLNWLSVGTVVTVGLVLVTPFSRTMLTGGVFRYGSEGLSQPAEVLFYRDGRTATVSASVKPDDEIVVLSTNGKPDASLGFDWLGARRGQDVPVAPITLGDESTQTLAGVFALAHAPQARSAVVIGQGSGMTGQAILSSPTLESLVTVEIEPEMIEGSQVFYPANARVFDDPRSSFALSDAKTFFAERGEAYDLIVSEPSNPWVSGVAGLFTTEFYDRASDYLAPDGLWVQWIHLYEISDALVETVLAAFAENFADFDLYMISNADLIVVASAEGVVPTPDWSVLDFDALREDLAHVPPIDPGALESASIADRATLAPLLAGVRANSDMRPVLEMRAERDRFVGGSAEGVLAIAIDRVRPGWTFTGRSVDPARDPGTWAIEPLAAGRMWSDATWLRRALDDSSTVGAVIPRRLSDRFTSQINLRARLEADTPPDNWRSWFGWIDTADQQLHRGMPGAYGPFFTLVNDYMDRFDAPEAVRLNVRILEGVARGDAAMVADAADDLVVPGRGGSWWLDTGVLMDAAAWAYLALDRGDDAKAVMELLEPLSGRSSTDVRSRLIRATAGS